jgi:hypothetical protein
MMTEELKPCPWCGSNAKIEKLNNDYNQFIVRCDNQEICRVNPWTFGCGEGDAITAWNTRHE